MTASVSLGTPAPDFDLPDLDGRRHHLANLHAPALLIAFMCNHCPAAKHVEGELAAIAKEYRRQGVEVLAICSNDPTTHPDDDVEGLRAQVERTGWHFPYLIDADQEVAREYRAVCTPDFFLYDDVKSLAYRGAMDTSSPGADRPNDGWNLREALDAVLDGRVVDVEQLSPLGCSIKWTPGTEPDWL